MTEDSGGWELGVRGWGKEAASLAYLESLLEAQRLPAEVESALRARRAEVEAILRGGWNGAEPRFYYGGSFGKKTMIAAQFDLDVVVYFPPEGAESPAELYRAVERRLVEAGHIPLRHNVSLRLEYTPGLHIDVVPGRAVDGTYEYARLYASGRNAERRTSLKKHIELARNSDREVVKLLKLWRWRNRVPVGSFVLELAVAAAARCRRFAAGKRGQAEACPTLESRFGRMLRYLAEEFAGARLVDPANAENVVSDDLDWGRKVEVAEAARAGCAAKSWEEVLW